MFFKFNFNSMQILRIFSENFGTGIRIIQIRSIFHNFLKLTCVVEQEKEGEVVAKEESSSEELDIDINSDEMVRQRPSNISLLSKLFVGALNHFVQKLLRLSAGLQNAETSECRILEYHLDICRQFLSYLLTMHAYLQTIS